MKDIDINTKNFNRATKFFRDMEFADPYDNRWGEFADAMDEVISTYVPVVRCKDCKYWVGNWMEEGNINNAKCTLSHRYPQPGDWFCADGEKR